MAIKISMDGPFTMQHCKEFIEDIANTSGYTLKSIQVTPAGSLFTCTVCYDDEIQPKKIETTNNKAVK